MPPIKGRKRGPYKKKYKKYYKAKSRFAYDKMKPYNMRFTRWSSKNTTNNVHLVMTGDATGSNQPGSTQFRFNDTAGFTELQNLFDNYTIKKVLYRFVLVRDPATVTAGFGIYPRLSWVHDFNDSIPISRAKMQEHPRMREVFFGDNYQRTKWYSLRPAALTTMFEGTTATAYNPSWGKFVDTNDVDMPFYGIKYVVSNLFTDNYIYLEAKLVLECKGIS